MAGGAIWGAAIGALLGAARAVAVVAAGVGPGQVGRNGDGDGATVMLWIVVGAAVGTMIGVLRDSQDQLAEAAVRERMARDLHDGVLQTLTLIERRSPSSEIARLAREQERELRSYLFGDSLASGFGGRTPGRGGTSRAHLARPGGHGDGERRRPAAAADR